MFRSYRMLVVLGMGIAIFSLAQGQLAASTVGFWNLNGNLTDASVSGFDGTFSGGAASYVTDSGRTALSLSNGDYVSIPSDSTFSFDGSATFEADIRTTNNDYAVFVDNTDSSGGWWMRTTAAGQLQSAVSDGTGAEIESTGSSVITDGAWHHVAAVYNRSTNSLDLYVDYQLETLSSVYDAGTPFTEAIGGESGSRIGCFNSGDNLRPFTGDVNYVRISDSALAPSQFVPEPSSIIILAIGILSLMAYAWKKR